MRYIRWTAVLNEKNDHVVIKHVAQNDTYALGIINAIILLFDVSIGVGIWTVISHDPQHIR